MEAFQRLLATKLNSDLENVEIISVQDVEGGLTDVRYSVHGSPYYPSSQTDSIVALNKAEVGKGLGLVGLGHKQNNSTRSRWVRWGWIGLGSHRPTALLPTTRLG